MDTRDDWIRNAERVLPALLGVALFLALTGFLFLEFDILLPTSLGHLAHPGPTLVGIAALLGALGVFFWLLLPSRRHRPEPAGHEAWVCPNCFHAYVPGAHFCPQCSAPVDEFAARGGYESIYATAWIVGKAVRRPTRWVHVLGILLFAVPTVISALFWLATFWRGDGSEPWMLFPSSLWAVVAGAFYVTILIVAWRNLRRHRVPTEEYGAPPSWTFDREWDLEPDGTPGEAPGPVLGGGAPVG